MSEATPNDDSKSEIKFEYKAAAFLGAVTGLSVVGGFGLALARTKKLDPEIFAKGVTNAGQPLESGSVLALRALGRGTLYAVTGFTLFCWSIWKLMGVHSLEEFRQVAGKSLPVIPRNDPPQSRTEFEGIRDLLQYLVDEDKKKKTGDT